MDSNERLAAIVQEISGSIEDYAIALVRKIEDPQDVNVKHECVELDKRILVSFHLITLFDGGVTARVMASMAGLQRPLWFSGVAFRVEAKQELYADMFRECVRLLPNEILCGQKAPVSELSKEYLKRNYLVENTSGNRHFEHCALFCQLCETHVKGLYDVLGHKARSRARSPLPCEFILHPFHLLLSLQRLQQRGKMVDWWRKEKPRISLSYKQFMHTLGGRIIGKINSFYELPEVASIGSTMEAFGSMQEDYSVEFLPIGGFSNRLITRDRTMPEEPE
ncbi:hypothetical protein M3Y99_00172400 [Aphelenchoides fujianensis]|nr:hypothetical protein M3Y99_00172400 [Aphelenchoides fujianensis]